MNENSDELIALLGARIGMIMEDVVVAALTMETAAPDDRSKQIGTLVEAVSELSSLAAALDTLRE